MNCVFSTRRCIDVSVSGCGVWLGVSDGADSRERMGTSGRGTLGSYVTAKKNDHETDVVHLLRREAALVRSLRLFHRWRNELLVRRLHRRFLVVVIEENALDELAISPCHPTPTNSLLLLFKKRVVLVILHTVERNLGLEVLMDSLVCACSLCNGAYPNYIFGSQIVLVS